MYACMPKRHAVKKFKFKRRNKRQEKVKVTFQIATRQVVFAMIREQRRREWKVLPYGMFSPSAPIYCSQFDLYKVSSASTTPQT